MTTTTTTGPPPVIVPAFRRRTRYESRVCERAHHIALQSAKLSTLACPSGRKTLRTVYSKLVCLRRRKGPLGRLGRARTSVPDRRTDSAKMAARRRARGGWRSQQIAALAVCRPSVVLVVARSGATQRTSGLASVARAPTEALRPRRWRPSRGSRAARSSSGRPSDGSNQSALFARLPCRRRSGRPHSLAAGRLFARRELWSANCN